MTQEPPPPKLPTLPVLTDRQQNVLTSLRTAVKTAPTPLRSCGECAKCCEGWLSGTVYGHEFSTGRPCFFLEKTCSIYADRPADPCRNYQCGWLSGDTFPMWLKPSLANIVITKRQDEKLKASYFIIDQAGDTFDERALNWIIKWATDTNANVEYRIKGEVNRVGTSAFVTG